MKLFMQSLRYTEPVTGTLRNANPKSVTCDMFVSGDATELCVAINASDLLLVKTLRVF